MNIQNISAASQKIFLEYPEKVDVNEEFEITINLQEFENDNYDAKVDIVDSDKQRISKIYDPELSDWKSSYYYVKNVISLSDNSGSVKMIIFEYGDKPVINIKVRDSKGAVKTFNNYPISVNNPEDKLSDLRPNNTQINTPIEQNKTITGQGIQENNGSDVIELEAKSIKSTIFLSDQEKVKQYSVYLFFVFLFLLAFFFTLRRFLKFKKAKDV